MRYFEAMNDVLESPICTSDREHWKTPHRHEAGGRQEGWSWLVAKEFNNGIDHAMFAATL